MAVKKYNKLVRDRIPEIIASTGKQCVTRILSREEYLEKLDEKLEEELAEYRQSGDMEELADLYEVLHATAVARLGSWEALEQLAAKKRQARGGFALRIALEEVWDG